MTETLLLVRAGGTAWDAAGRVCGLADPSLDARGVSEAESLADGLARYAPTLVVTSPLRRAVRTGGVIAQESNATLVIDPRFIDRDFGQWTGAMRVEVERKRRSIGRSPGVESVAGVMERARQALDELVVANPGVVLVIVTHDAVIRPLLADLVPKQATGMALRTGSWSRLVRDDGNWRAEALDREASYGRRPRQALGHG